MTPTIPPNRSSAPSPARCARFPGEPELEVTFVPEQPSLRGKKARLPLPSRSLPPEEVAAVRGAGDAYALKLAYHEDSINRELKPAGAEANVLFDAVEQARVEAIGALAMKGVSANLSAITAQRMKAHGLAAARDRAEAPLADVLGLMVRERLTGEAPPDFARAAVDLWRPLIEEKAGTDLAQLTGAMRDQRAFQRLTRKILHDLDFADDIADEKEDGAEDDEQKDQSKADEGTDNDDQDVTPTEAEMSEAEGESGEDVKVEMETETADMADVDDAKDGKRPYRPELPFSNTRDWDYKVFTQQFDETTNAENLCDPDELTRLRNFLDQQLLPMQGVVARLANKLQRLLDGAAEPLLGVRSRGRHARYRAPAAHHHRSAARALVQDGARNRFPRHRGDAAPRQFGLDARAPDHGRGDVRRHPRAHARTLRGEGRGAGLHHARLEGRPVAREMDRRRQAAASRPPERPAPHHLQGGRRAVAARAQESRPDDARRPAEGEHRRRGADVGA